MQVSLVIYHSSWINTNGLKGVSASNRCLVSTQIITYLSYHTKAEEHQTKSNYTTEFDFPSRGLVSKVVAPVVRQKSNNSKINNNHKINLQSW